MPLTLLEPVTPPVLNLELYSIQVEVPVLLVPKTIPPPVTQPVTLKDSTLLPFQPPPTESPPLSTHVNLVEPEPYLVLNL